MNNNIFYNNIVIVSNFMHLPTYPGVPQAVAIMLSSSSVLDRPKSLIIIFESSSGLQDRQNNPCELACNKLSANHKVVLVSWKESIQQTQDRYYRNNQISKKTYE